jgi:ATP-dependent RNA helicase RhlE
VYRVSKEHKRHLLAHLISDGNWHQVLVFTRTKHGANRLAEQLEHNGIRSAAIHGNKSQSARVRALADFKANKVIALVATEVAARGLDIKELPQVVNYELPNVPEDYVHRIGRTARAGGTGRAVSLVSPDEAPLLRDIERLLRRSLPVSALPQFPISAREPRGPESQRGSQPGERSNGRRSGGRQWPQRDSQSERRSQSPRGSQSQRHSQGEPHSRPQQYSQPSPEEQRPWESPSHAAQPARHHSHSEPRRHSAAPGGAKPGATRSWRPRGRPGSWARHTGRPR